MNQKRITKDEQFLMRLYDEGAKKGDPFLEMDAYHVGQLIGQNDKSVKNIVRMLTQTNFIKQKDGNLVYITKQGENLVLSLR